MSRKRRAEDGGGTAFYKKSEWDDLDDHAHKLEQLEKRLKTAESGQQRDRAGTVAMGGLGLYGAHKLYEMARLAAEEVKETAKAYPSMLEKPEDYMFGMDKGKGYEHVQSNQVQSVLKLQATALKDAVFGAVFRKQDDIQDAPVLAPVTDRITFDPEYNVPRGSAPDGGLLKDEAEFLRTQAGEDWFEEQTTTKFPLGYRASDIKDIPEDPNSNSGPQNTPGLIAKTGISMLGQYTGKKVVDFLDPVGKEAELNDPTSLRAQAHEAMQDATSGVATGGIGIAAGYSAIAMAPIAAGQATGSAAKRELQQYAYHHGNQSRGEAEFEGSVTGGAVGAATTYVTATTLAGEAVTATALGMAVAPAVVIASVGGALALGYNEYMAAEHPERGYKSKVLTERQQEIHDELEENAPPPKSDEELEAELVKQERYDDERISDKDVWADKSLGAKALDVVSGKA